MEKKFEAAEKAIYRLQQKGDEANDSYLARAAVLWQELLSKGMQLSELQAYIVLRGSLLSAEDKKKVILDSDVGDNGTLEMDRVQKAIRLLGAGFFQEMTSGKRYGGGKYKTYDNTALMAEEEDDDWAQHVSDGAMMDEDEALEQLLHEGDEDALMISEFEAAAQDVLQEDANLASAFSAYTEARRKLSEKVRFRGFFPVSKGKGKPGNKGGKGKGFRGFQRDRKPLSQRILRSQCRRCLQFGHWKDECPLKTGDGPSTSATSGGGASASGSFAGNTTIQVPESPPLEFLNLQEFASVSLDDMAINEESGNKHTVFMTVHGMFGRIGHDNQSKFSIGHERTPIPIARALCRLRSRRSSKLYEGSDRSCSEQVASTVSHREAEAFISSSGLSPNHGILDTGATKTVIGSELVKDLLASLDPSVRKMVSRSPCQVTFRFGNLSTSQSQQALVIPIGRLNLKVAVVPGYTPFLLSNTLMRALKAKIDTSDHMLESPFFLEPVPLFLTQKGLYLVDVNLMAKLAEAVVSGSHRESFVNIDMATPGKNEEEPDFVHVEAHVETKCNNNDKGSLVLGINQPQVREPTRSEEESSDRKACARESFRSNCLPEHFVKSGDSCHHVQLGSSLEANPGGVGREGRGPIPVLPASTRGDEGDLRKHSQREKFPRHVDQPPVVDQLVCKPLCKQPEEGTSSHDPLHRIESREMRAGRHSGSQDGWTSGKTCFESGTSQDPRLCSTEAQDEAAHQDGAIGRDGGIMGRAGNGEHPGQGDSGSDQCFVQQDAQHGERDAANPPVHPRTTGECFDPAGLMTESVDRYWMLAGDHDYDERCYVDVGEINHIPDDTVEKRRFHRLVAMYTSELHNMESTYSTSKSSALTLFEVFCSDQSQLTNQCQRMSCRAERFGYAQGDLHTVEGRATLFQNLVTKRPRHIWYSPMCGPWCAFSALNASKSPEAYADIHAHRLQHIADLALGVVLLRYQLLHGNHLHWEQPGRSLMFRNPLLKEVYRIPNVLNLICVV